MKSSTAIEITRCRSYVVRNIKIIKKAKIILSIDLKEYIKM